MGQSDICLILAAGPHYSVSKRNKHLLSQSKRQLADQQSSGRGSEAQDTKQMKLQNNTAAFCSFFGFLVLRAHLNPSASDTPQGRTTSRPPSRPDAVEPMSHTSDLTAVAVSSRQQPSAGQTDGWNQRRRLQINIFTTAPHETTAGHAAEPGASGPELSDPRGNIDEGFQLMCTIYANHIHYTRRSQERRDIHSDINCDEQEDGA